MKEGYYIAKVIHHLYCPDISLPTFQWRVRELGIHFPITHDQIPDVVNAVLSYKSIPKEKQIQYNPDSINSQIRELLLKQGKKADNRTINKYAGRVRLRQCTVEQACDDEWFKTTKRQWAKRVVIPKEIKEAYPNAASFGTGYFAFDPKLVFYDEVMELAKWLFDGGFEPKPAWKVYRLAALNIMLKYHYIDNDQYWEAYEKLFFRFALTKEGEKEDDE